MLMTCRNVRQLHDAFVDGELSASLTAEVHAHLLQCPECQHEIEMLRAATDVIAQDHAEPILDSGFASRVIAQMPKPITVIEDAPEEVVEHNRRSRFIRIFAKGAVPAAAAALFLGVLIWPTFEHADTQSRVLGTSVAVDAFGVKSVLSPSLDAVADTKQAATSLNRLLQISVNKAGQQVRDDLAAKAGETRTDDVGLVDVLMQPFNGMIESPDDQAAPGEPEIVRF